MGASQPAPLFALCIPFDVLEHHIIRQLNASCLVACSLVSSQFRKLSSKQLPHNKLDQYSILEDIFRNGWADLLSWFQARLKYPSMADLGELRPPFLNTCLSLASQGEIKILFDTCK